MLTCIISVIIFCWWVEFIDASAIVCYCFMQGTMLMTLPKLLSWTVLHLLMLHGCILRDIIAA